MIEKAPAMRTDQEKAALNALAERIKQRRVQSAQFALDEYNTWKFSPCTYEPPDGFTYPGRQLCAAARLNPAVAGPIDPPKFEEFQAYGVARAYAVFQDLKVQKSMDQVVRAATYFGSVTGGAALGGALAASITRGTLKAIFPFAGRLAAGGTAISSVAAGIARILGIAVPVLIIVGAIVTAVLRGIDVADIEAIPGKLQGKLAEVQNAPLPDLAQLVRTDPGKQELYGAYII